MQTAGKRGSQTEGTASAKSRSWGMSLVCGRSRNELLCWSGAGGRVVGARVTVPGAKSDKEMPGECLWDHEYQGRHPRVLDGEQGGS